MRESWKSLVGGMLVTVIAAGLVMADPKKKENKFEADLDGYQEAPLTLSVAGNGEFEAELNEAGTMLSFELKYSDLTGAAGASHVHLGRPGTTGGPMFFLCGGGGKPACPAGASATITGTVTSADILAVAGQGIAAGEFAEALEAMRRGAAYVNVHTAAYPGGEIRGQIDDRRKKERDDDD